MHSPLPETVRTHQLALTIIHTGYCSSHHMQAKLTLQCQLRGNRNPGEYFSTDFVKMEVQYSVQKYMKACRLYKVCYILKGRNTREYISPDFVKMEFQVSVTVSSH